MDELEIRRRLLANPQDTMAHLSEQDRLLQSELQAFDMQLTRALQIPVPSELEHRLLFNQPRRRLLPWVMAASLALVSVLGIQQFQHTQRADNLGLQALHHVRHELGAFQSTAEIPLEEVNQLLAEVGGNLAADAYPVRYARFCDFEGTRSLHLVFAKEDGLVTVFVVPNGHGLKRSPAFSDPQFFGKSQQLAQAEIVMVASQQQLLDPFAKTLMEKMNFQS